MNKYEELIYSLIHNCNREISNEDMQILNQASAIYNTYNQLTEQLGCPLECIVAVFKAMQQDYIYCDIGSGMYKLHNFKLNYFDLADDYYFTKSEYHYVLDDDCCIFVEDYKKTWWLKEDKSE